MRGSLGGRSRRLAQKSARKASSRKIAIVHYTALPVIGGVETIMEEHVHQLLQRGHDLRVIAGSGDCEQVPELDSRHPLVEKVTCDLAAGKPCLEEFNQLRDLIEKKLAPLLADRDLVIAHNVMTMPFNLPLSHALVNSGRPLLAWTHDLAWNDSDYLEYRRSDYPYDLLCHPQPDTTYVAISQIRQREIVSTLGLSESAVPVIPNGIEVSHGSLSAQTIDLLEQANCQGAWPLVLLPVRVTSRKRIELAMTTVAHLRKKYPDLRLVITGPPAVHNIDDRTYATKLKSLQRKLELEQTVCFLHELGEGGQHPVDDVIMADLYRLADCVFLTSEAEGFGIPAIEAGRARVPLVASDIEIFREITGGAAYLFPPKSPPQKIAAMVDKALANPITQLNHWVAERYGWNRIVELIEQVINSNARKVELKATAEEVA